MQFLIWLSLGKRTPINQGLLFLDFGTICDTRVAEHLFNGNYTFPPGSDEATISLLQEESHLRLELNTLPHNNREYLAFWSTTKETTSSSKSGCYFGHYKAICSHPDRVHLYVRSINLAIRCSDS